MSAVEPIGGKLTPELKLAVGSKEAARMLGIGLDHLAELRKKNLIATVPHLSTPKKLIYAVRELERVAALGVGPARALKSVAS